MRLSKIETIVEIIHGAQIVEAQDWKPGYEERINKHAAEVEEYISRHSEALGLKMVRHIYGRSDDPVLPRDRRRKWSDWEI